MTKRHSEWMPWPGQMLFFALLPACNSSSSTLGDTSTVSDRQAESDRDTTTVDTLTHLELLSSQADYDRLKSAKDTIKFLLRVDGRSAPAPLDAACIFQNSKRWDYHLMFIRSFPEFSTVDVAAYEKMVLVASSRIWWGGLVKLWPTKSHPRTQRTGVISYSIWHESGSNEELSVAQFTEIDRRLKKCIPYAADSMVLLPEGEQVAYLHKLHSELVANQIDVLFP